MRIGNHSRLQIMSDLERWPPLPLAAWRDTYATLHMWTQIVGKVCLALTPRTNHWWNIAFQISARGLVTPVMPVGSRALTIVFDFVDHQLVICCSDGGEVRLALEPRPVAEFYRLFMDALHRLGVSVHVWPMPVEVADPIRFDRDDVHRAYDPASARAFWEILLAIKPILERFRSEFVGKCSPVHFFWGSFDVAVTRFSGRRAPERPGADAMTREAYSHEVISHGFWPGGGAVAEPVFYAYAAPEPAGFKDAPVAPSAAFYSKDFNEFILPYEAVRTAASPADDLTAFLTSTYDAAATLAGWDRPNLERKAVTV
ncbi:MAG TPA: DUF5996 family protein [Vicinamibacterales bacterium]|nr:DUF5996 family protein [Vicinamibacterales bacterium]